MKSLRPGELVAERGDVATGLTNIRTKKETEVGPKKNLEIIQTILIGGKEHRFCTKYERSLGLGKGVAGNNGDQPKEKNGAGLMGETKGRAVRAPIGWDVIGTSPGNVKNSDGRKPGIS